MAEDFGENLDEFQQDGAKPHSARTPNACFSEHQLTNQSSQLVLHCMLMTREY